MTTHLTSWGSKMSFQRSKKSPKSPRRSPGAKSTMGLASTPVVTSSAVGGGSLSVSEKEFVEKGKKKNFYLILNFRAKVICFNILRHDDS